MDFCIDNEWIVDTNTDKLNSDLFGDVNESQKVKPSRRRKRKVKTASPQSTLKQNSQVSLESQKSTIKDNLWTHNLKKRKRKFNTSISENSTDSIKNSEHKKEIYNHQEYQKLDSQGTESSELSSKTFSKLDHCNKLKKERTRQMKTFYKQSLNDTINLSMKKKYNVKNEVSLSVGKLDGNSSSINYTNSSITKKKRKNKKKTIMNFAQNNLKDSGLSGNQSSLEKVPNSSNLSMKKKCNVKNEVSLSVSKLDGNSSNINYTNSSITKKKRKNKKKTMNFAQNNLQDSGLSDNQSSLEKVPNSSNCSKSLNITKLKDILKLAKFSHTTNLKLEAKKRKKGMLILEKGKRKEYSDIVRKQAVDKLNSARFRFINEKMYTATGKDSMHLFKLDPDAFEIYHGGFQAQVDKWPLNPVDIIIGDISKKPKTLKIADFGCGNAKIAQVFPDRKVYSFDFISMNNYVTACDMANVPLARESIDIVVFCLALMGTNLKDCLCEAHRVLKMGGQLKIAEVVSRMENPDTFVDDLKQFGFTLLEKNISHKMFIFFDFTKTGKFDRTKLPTVELKPCLYKKR